MPGKSEVRPGRAEIRVLRSALAVAAALMLFVAGCGSTEEPVADSDFFELESSTIAPTTTTTTTTTSVPAPPPLPEPVETEIIPELPPTPKPPPPPPVEPRSSCDPSYPDVCIAPGPPDLDCGDVPYTDIQVLSPDPHRLDGNDNDGVGCES